MGIPARILALARTRRCCRVAIGSMKARATSSLLRPQTVRRVSATCASSARAGWQQVKIRRRRSSGHSASSSLPPIGPNGGTERCPSASISVKRRARRSRSIARRRATATSHADGFVGAPERGHCSSATAKASCRLSSARSKSPSRRIRVARARRRISPPPDSNMAASSAGFTGLGSLRGRTGRSMVPVRRDSSRHGRSLVEIRGFDEKPALLLGLSERAVGAERLPSRTRTLVAVLIGCGPPPPLRCPLWRCSQ